MIDLDRSLGELADRLQIRGGEWLVDDVVRRLGEPAGRHPPRRVVLFAGALAAVAVLAVVTLPGPRHAVARWLGFDSVRIEPGVTVPTTAVVAATTTSSATDTTLSSTTEVEAITTTSDMPTDLGLGSSVALPEAISRTGLPNPTPLLLGDAQSIHVVQPPQAGQIVLVYAPSDLVPQSTVTGVGALVSVMPAKIEEGLFAKMLGNVATVRSVDVDGAAGYWIEGSPHQLFFQIGDQIQPDTLRLATNTLLWQREGHVYRLEADVSLQTALRIAGSVN
jgi:hypothetical protein